jgi:hypothetical protein
MLNIRELEKRWLKYKIKSYIPHAVIIVSIIIISTISFIFINSWKTNETVIKKHKENKIPLQQNKKIDKVTIIEKNSIQKIKPLKETTPVNKTVITPRPIQTTTETQLTLKPSMSFIKHIQHTEQQPYYKTIHTTQHKKKKTIKKQKTKISQHKNKQIKKKSEEKVQQRNNYQTQDEPRRNKEVIKIERRDSQKDIKDIIARFKKNNNPALSLFVAKKAYELGNYKQAYNYALITNGINNHIEESWLIFAKSLVKLKRKNMAIKTLREYIKYSHSGNAKILLNDIKSGKFQ